MRSVHWTHMYFRDKPLTRVLKFVVLVPYMNGQYVHIHMPSHLLPPEHLLIQYQCFPKHVYVPTNTRCLIMFMIAVWWHIKGLFRLLFTWFDYDLHCMWCRQTYGFSFPVSVYHRAIQNEWLAFWQWQCTYGIYIIETFEAAVRDNDN